MVKYLLEFHRARPTRETLKQSISSGNLELFKLVRERLPEAELRDRVDLLEVAAEFHQPEVFVWLLRDATVCDRELSVVFTLERKIAEVLMVALESGSRPWWFGTREMALQWRSSSQMVFATAPEGFSTEGGWWKSVSGVVSALPAGRCEAESGSAQPGPGMTEGTDSTVSALNGNWTAEMSRSRLGKKSVVKSVVFPAGVTAIGERALAEFCVLESVVFPAGCTAFDSGAFHSCTSLRAVGFPAGCRGIGGHAFCRCKSLASAVIPVGCTTIGKSSFFECSSLTSVRIPDGRTSIGGSAFAWSSLKRVIIPGDCEIGHWAFHCCRSLVVVEIGAGCTTIGTMTFCGCTALAWVMLPSTVKSIGKRAFENCRALGANARGCQVHKDAFNGSTTRVLEL
jgi:hypothetical protein